MKFIILIFISALSATAIYTQETVEKFANADAPSQNIGKDSLGASGYDLTEYFTKKR